jgi:2-desacetyl-2-hydroxyethyl bacteriochlorophyllide A dehydrogenase
MMKVAVYQGLQKIALQEVDYMKPRPGYVTVDTRCTGICGSDLHNYFGNWPPSDTWAQGHETCGLVAEVGEGVTAFKPGDLVAVECFSHCGDCVYCRTGAYNHCLNRKWVSDQAHGGFAEYTMAHASGLFKLPATMSFAHGALVEPLAVCWRALAQAKATHEDRVAIIGGGTIGLYCLAVAKAIGVKETLITVKYDQQTQLAAAYGADHIVNISQTSVKDYVAELTDNFGLDVVIETVGGGQNFTAALDIVRKQGRVVLVAGYHQPLEVDPRRIVWGEVQVTGSNCYGFSGMQTDFQAAIDLIASGKLDAGKLVTHTFPFEQLIEAFHIAADKGSGSVKVQVTQA